MPQTTNGLIDLNEISEYYKYFELQAEVKPVLKCLSKISTKQVKPDLIFPLDEWSIIKPSEVNRESM